MEATPRLTVVKLAGHVATIALLVLDVSLQSNNLKSKVGSSQESTRVIVRNEAISQDHFTSR